MSTTTPNFGWVVPTSSDLVKNGAVAIETLGDSIDASMVDLKGGTTGQVLSKTSNTDMDFTWTTPSGGTNSFYAGKNKIINGDFNINQRGFTSTTTNLAFGFDRFFISYSGGSLTNSAQTFTAGTAPVTGYEGKNFARLVTASQSAAGDFAAYVQRIESVRTFAAQTVTVSMWAKASTGTPKIGVSISQDFGTGGGASSLVITSPATQTITSSWVRYSFTVAVPSIAGKTIGTSGDNLTVTFWTSAGTTISGLGYPAVGIQNATIDTWGWQIEAGSTATDFVTASGNSPQGELAMCQRYYVRFTPNGSTQAYLPATNFGVSATAAIGQYQFPQTMRISPTGVDGALGGYLIDIATGTGILITTVTLNQSSNNVGTVLLNVAAGLTTYRPYYYGGGGVSSAFYVGFSAEL
jgi:hypothetical protein